MTGASRPGRIRRGIHGVYAIRASSAPLAYEQWGWVDGRDRCFQMDLMRRAAAGRLAELFGRAAVDSDAAQRRYGLEDVAEQVVAALPVAQHELLTAYVSGVNQGVGQSWRPPEYILVRSRPQPWRPTDTLLVLLFMYQQLALDVDGARTVLTLRESLTPEVVRFLTPRGDEFNVDPDFGAPVPVDALVDLLRSSADLPSRDVIDLPPVGGSNCWAVGATRSRHGTPLLANDMHLGFTTPNAFHRVDVRYPGGRALGFALPGLPLLACGSNGSVAWGLANIPADVTRLVPAPGEQITERTELIHVRGGEPMPISIRCAPAGPVLPEPVLGRSMALQWNALRPEATDLRWMELLEARTADDACAIAHHSGSPPLAMIIVDADSNIVQTVSGRYPNRTDTELLPGFVGVDRLPVVRTGADGTAVWANDPPHPRSGGDVGANFPASYRRFRIAELLETRDDWDEPALFRMQRDDSAGFYVFYHDLALRVTDRLQSPLAGEAADALRAWDGRSGPDSLGIALIVAFRARLVRDLMARLLRRCAAADPAFRYTWRNPEPVLRRLLREMPHGVAPLLDGSADWPDYLARRVEAAARRLSARHPRVRLGQLRWRDVMRVEVPHPMAVRGLTRIFSLKHLVPEGGPESIAAYGAGRGPVQRLVVAPGREHTGLAQMPGGQSGVLYSRFYRDQHRAWRAGRSSPLETASGRPAAHHDAETSPAS